MSLESFLEDCLAAPSPADRAAEAVYHNALANLDKTNNEIIIPFNVVDVITKANVRKLQHRFSIARNVRIRAVRDSAISAVRLMAVHDEFLPVNPEIHREISKEVHEAVHHAGVKIPGIPARVPRPPNSFILYRQSLHSSTTAENPGLPNTQISRVIADKWRNESPEVRAHFKALADEMKRQHELDHPDYQYSPRRPGERRRRRPRIHANKLQFLGANMEGTQRLVNAWTGRNHGYVEVDDQLLRIFDGHGMLFGPCTVGPQPGNNNEDFNILVQDQLDRIPSQDLSFSPLNTNDFDANFNMDELLNLQ